MGRIVFFNEDGLAARRQGCQQGVEGLPPPLRTKQKLLKLGRLFSKERAF
jgi:hypothetical protein